jgi:hypothetical protein
MDHFRQSEATTWWHVRPPLLIHNQPCLSPSGRMKHAPHSTACAALGSPAAKPLGPQHDARARLHALPAAPELGVIAPQADQQQHLVVGYRRLVGRAARTAARPRVRQRRLRMVARGAAARPDPPAGPSAQARYYYTHPRGQSFAHPSMHSQARAKPGAAQP